MSAHPKPMSPAQKERQNVRSIDGKYAPRQRGESQVSLDAEVVHMDPRPVDIAIDSSRGSLAFPPVTNRQDQCQQFWTSVEIPDAVISAYAAQVRRDEEKAVASAWAKAGNHDVLHSDWYTANPLPEGVGPGHPVAEEWSARLRAERARRMESGAVPRPTVEQVMGRPELSSQDARAVFVALMMHRNAPDPKLAPDHHEAVMNSTMSLHRAPALKIADAQRLYGVEDVEDCIARADSSYGADRASEHMKAISDSVAFMQGAAERQETRTERLISYAHTMDVSLEEIQGNTSDSVEITVERDRGGSARMVRAEGLARRQQERQNNPVRRP